MTGSSYLNGYRFANKEEYKPIVIQTARPLSIRLCPNPGVIQPWDVGRGQQAKRGWKCPVIIDSIMSLELMSKTTRLSGDLTLYNIARRHVDTTMANHFRADNSCHHVTDYDLEMGEVRKKQTAQGCIDELAWARGQAWALYDYMMCYRYTHDVRYLEQAEKVYGFIFNNKNLSEDPVPYWDLDVPKIPDESHDISVAACMASTLYKLDTYILSEGYKEKASRTMESPVSPVYRARVGTNSNFILMHSVGNIPHGAKVDAPLSYADCYSLKALMRKRDLEK